MPSRPTPPARVVVLGPLALCILALALAGCGRRGALDAPSSPARTSVATGPASGNLATRAGAAALDSPDGDIDEGGTTFVSPQPNPVKRGRAYSVPNEPFILDPLL